MNIKHVFLVSFISSIQSEKPNVIIILTDDFGIGDFRLNNRFAKVPTPNIDQLGAEGINFRDGHSASSRCGPSRYMLLTGRYSLERREGRSLHPDTPHLGKLFESQGYTTGIYGKKQPLQAQPVHAKHQEQLKISQRLRDMYSNPLGWLAFGRSEKVNVFIPGQYNLNRSPSNFHHSFLSTELCCSPGTYFENGIGTSPATKYAIQRLYSSDFPLYPVYSPPFYDYEHNDTPIMKRDNPRNVLVAEDFDSRDVETITAGKVLDFIDEYAGEDKPFFMYYAPRLGHSPFNTPESYRNKTLAGIVGEAIMLTDEIVGKILNRLKQHGIDDNTLVLFTSDNGSHEAEYLKNLYDHNPNGIDVVGRERTWSLRGKKNDIWDGGNRVPLIFRWPGKIPPRVNQENVVSLMDIYGTMADILGVERACYEAPDSRSLWPLLTNQATDITPSSIIHHGLNDATVALRKNQYKWIPEYHQLFNMRLDLGEENNLIGTISKTGHSYTNLAISMNNTLNAMLNTINEREIRQAQGTRKIC